MNANERRAAVRWMSTPEEVEFLGAELRDLEAVVATQKVTIKRLTEENRQYRADTAEGA